ncbi:hypothetical protein EV182_003300 [Spiromyces aspiralis]|uniref:Uncharacterized protein n=1 Tax=Spiromyces aspiralis TaxID=68401 RepID=A0ACC1HWR8_9FUNG|nr:hypothetical protein EV182_003300 [Spiromyces aspiralis]
MNPRVQLPNMWTSPNHKQFMGINAHWIDQGWDIHSLLIGFEEVPESHTGDYLALKLADVLDF